MTPRKRFNFEIDLRMWGLGFAFGKTIIVGWTASIIIGPFAAYWEQQP